MSRWASNRSERRQRRRRIILPPAATVPPRPTPPTNGDTANDDNAIEDNGNGDATQAHIAVESDAIRNDGDLVRTATIVGWYRYELSRIWHPASGRVVFVGLNPSTADAERDDPTIRRLIRFARDWGFGGLTVVNLFAFRAADPRALARTRDPIGPQNDRTIRRVVEAAAMVVPCWGNGGRWANRSIEGRRLLRSCKLAPGQLHCLGLTAQGEPRHPLYLPATTPLEPFPSERLE